MYKNSCIRTLDRKRGFESDEAWRISWTVKMWLLLLFTEHVWPWRIEENYRSNSQLNYWKWTSVIAQQNSANQPLLAQVLKHPKVNSFHITPRLVYLVLTKYQELNIKQCLAQLFTLIEYFRGVRVQKTITTKLIWIQVISIWLKIIWESI